MGKVIDQTGKFNKVFKDQELQSVYEKKMSENSNSIATEEQKQRILKAMRLASSFFSNQLIADNGVKNN